MKAYFCKDFIRTGQGDWRAWCISHSTMRWSSQQQHAGSVELTLLQVYFTWKYIGNSHTRTRRRQHRCSMLVWRYIPTIVWLVAGQARVFSMYSRWWLSLHSSLIIHTSRGLLQQSVLVDYYSLLLFSSNFWCKYSIRFLYWSPKQEALALNASRRICWKSTRCLI